VSDSENKPDPQDHFELAPEPEPATPRPAQPAPRRMSTEEYERKLREEEEARLKHEQEEKVRLDLGEGMPKGAPLISPRLRNARNAAIAAGVLLAAAVIIAMIRADSGHLPLAAKIIYDTALASALGVCAAFAFAAIQERPLGSWTQGAARMALAVALAQVVLQCSVGGGAGKALFAVLALVAYLAALIVLMDWKPRMAFRVGVFHFALQALVWLAIWLDGTVERMTK